MNSVTDTVKSVFIFVNSNSSSTNPDEQAAFLLRLLHTYLTVQKYHLSDVEYTKLGHSTCRVVLKKCEISVLLSGGTRTLSEITIITDRVQLSEPSPEEASDWAMLCEDIKDFLMRSPEFSSLQHVTRNEAEFLWRSRQRPHKLGN